jgi:predicted nucleic acid-binding protein
LLRWTNIVGHGRMLVVDASCLYEALVGGSRADTIRDRLEIEPDQAAPHVIDVEVFSVVRREHRAGRLDRTAASQAIEDLEAWPAERFSHRLLLDRAWQLRDAVRGWDAMYVALAEALNAILLTSDQRLANAAGPRCEIEVL